MAKVLVPVEQYVGGEDYSRCEWLPAAKAPAWAIRDFMTHEPLSPRECRHLMLHLARKAA